MATSPNFLESLIEADLAQSPDRALQTRFPPEPNGYLHIGHAKAICLNFGLAERFGGSCNLRFDDTNPSKENVEYVEGIQRDIEWLGFQVEGHTFYASDYFDKLFSWCLGLLQKGAAYVDEQSLEEIRAGRGSLGKPGLESPFRERPVEENVALFKRMRDGDFEPGHCVVRAKIDMAAKNLLMRDPVLYRISNAHHHRTGDRWCIYPTYDWAHGQSDAIEGVTHSICTLEFENHRPLYEWCLEQVGVTDPPKQIEFARLNLSYTMVSKRKLLPLIEGGIVSGWDDPRMPTLAGMRRRGYTPEAIRAFAAEVGVSRVNGVVDMVVLENALRDDLNQRAPRRLGVVRPLKLVIENYPEGESEELDAVNNPQDEAAGTRKVPFGRELWIEADDFQSEAPRKFHRLTPGREVRLRYAYYVTCTGFECDDDGHVTEVRCSYDPETRGGDSADGRKVKGTIHWVSANHAIDAELRLYDHLFASADPAAIAAADDVKQHLNPDSLEVVCAKLEPSLASAAVGEPFQLERQGYFCADDDSTPERLVLNRSVALRSSWAKIEEREKASQGS